MMLKLLPLISFLCVMANAQDTQPNGFQEGTRLLQESKFEESAAVFKSEYESGKNFAALFYNWGLAEYGLKHPGLATALWRKALYIDPEFINAHRALSFIDHELPHQNFDGSFSLWDNFEQFLSQNLSLNKLFFLTWILLLFTAFLFIKYFSQRKEALKSESPLPKFPNIAVGFGVLFVVSALVTLVKITTLFEARATVVVKSVPLRTSPNDGSNAIFDLFEGLDVTIKTVESGWALVSLKTGVSGWVSGESLFQHSGNKKL